MNVKTRPNFCFRVNGIISNWISEVLKVYADLVSCGDYRSDAEAVIGQATYNDLLEGDLYVISTIVPLSRIKIQLHTVEYTRVRAFVIMQTCKYSFCGLRVDSCQNSALSGDACVPFPHDARYSVPSGGRQ